MIYYCTLRNVELVVCAGRGMHVSSHTAMLPDPSQAPLDVLRPHYVAHTPALPGLAPPGVDTAVQPLPPVSLTAPLTMTVPPPCHLPPPGVPLGPPPRPHIHLPPLPPVPAVPPLLPPVLGAPAPPPATHRAAVIAGTTLPTYPLTGDSTLTHTHTSLV